MLMVLEFCFFQFPREVVIPPAACLAASGKMNIGMAILCGELGVMVYFKPHSAASSMDF